MSFQFPINKSGKPTATAITIAQRSTCEVVFYRFKQTDITKIEALNVSSDRSLSGSGQRSTEGNLELRDRMHVRSDVVACTINKNKAASSGTFSLTLKRGKEVSNGQVLPTDIDYLKAIHPGDWVMIYMKKSGKVNVDSIKPSDGLKFLGIVENVRYLELDDPNRATPRLEYLITGRDFGKVFENELFFNPTINNQQIQTLLGAKFLTDSKDTIKGDNRAETAGFSPDVVVKNLVSFFLGGQYTSLNSNNQVWYVPKLLGRMFKPKAIIKSGGVSFADILATDRIGVHHYKLSGAFDRVSRMPGAALIKSLPATGTVWSVLQFMHNAAINEMFTELTLDTKTGNLIPALVMRQVPFSNKPGETSPFTANARPASQGGNGKLLKDKISEEDKTFFVNLPRHEIVSSNIKQKNVGKSDHERVNHVIVTPKIDSETYNLLYETAYNVPSVQRYGLKSLQTQTSYILSGLNGEGIRTYIERCVTLLVDWFFMSHQLFNGTLIVDGVDEHVELGTNLYISDVKQLYHIEGYTHNYELREDKRTVYQTEFRVSRGQVLSENRNSSFIGLSKVENEPTTISTSVLEGVTRA